VTRLVREVAAEGCDAIAIHCPNFRGLGAARLVRAETGIPVPASVAGPRGGARAPPADHGSD